MMRALVVLLFVSTAATARAHPMSPASLELVERDARHFTYAFRRPRVHESALSLAFPGDCKITPRGDSMDGDALVTRGDLVCAEPLVGRTLHVLGLAERGLGALVHTRFRDGRTAQVLLGPALASVALPAAPAPLAVFGQYLRLGVEHFAFGLDHVLFVVGLFALVRALGRLLLVLTAFTLGHSVTLCLAALELVRVPGAAVEVGIALSLMLVAYELLEPRAQPDVRASALAVFSLGLLHGLGFASALAQAGLAEGDVPLSLFGFNLGIEVGQVALVLALAPLAVFVRRARPGLAPALRGLTGYGIGALAAMWTIERGLALFG